MFSTILQLWAGSFYLLNKVFFSRAERNEGPLKQRWRISAWIVYIIGLPAWTIIFVSERNWIAAALEIGGMPAMVLGLIVAIRGKGKAPRWLDYCARVAIFIGLSYSLYGFGGITTINQILELSIALGFLVGTYCLAKQQPSGYLWFMLMNVSNAILMGIEAYPWLALQQVVSLGFVIDAFLTQRRKTNKDKKLS